MKAEFGKTKLSVPRAIKKTCHWHFTEYCLSQKLQLWAWLVIAISFKQSSKQIEQYEFLLQKLKHRTKWVHFSKANNIKINVTWNLIFLRLKHCRLLHRLLSMPWLERGNPVLSFPIHRPSHKKEIYYFTYLDILIFDIAGK